MTIILNSNNNNKILGYIKIAESLPFTRPSSRPTLSDINNALAATNCNTMLHRPSRAHYDLQVWSSTCAKLSRVALATQPPPLD